MDLCRRNSSLFEKIFHAEDHFLGAADEYLVGLCIIYEAGELVEFFVVDATGIQGGICSFTTQHVNEGEAIDIVVLQAFELFEEENRTAAAIAVYERETA